MRKPVNRWGDYDPSRGRPLKSRAEALEWQERNRQEARKRALRGWATRRAGMRAIDAAVADAVARDDR